VKRELKVDFAVVGAGSAGLSFAAGAAQLGASVVLFEQAAMGGDCLNTGCVPSKALIAAAAKAKDGSRRAAVWRERRRARDRLPGVMAHVHGAIAAIAPHDSQGALRGLSVTVVANTSPSPTAALWRATACACAPAA
jgi:pyruvate/2-oxoglutarate dehydrogenase complex dihydrolipoamide dehydrogenase (E3) component